MLNQSKNGHLKSVGKTESQCGKPAMSSLFRLKVIQRNYMREF